MPDKVGAPSRRRGQLASLCADSVQGRGGGWQFRDVEEPAAREADATGSPVRIGHSA